MRTTVSDGHGHGVRALLLLLLTINVRETEGFVIGEQTRRTLHLTALCGSLDYEYLPPNGTSLTGLHPSASNLQSAYPDGTPAGMRGEAVRSALRSGQCIGWKLDQHDAPLECGVVRVRGKGCVAFLNNKLTRAFPASWNNKESLANTGIFRKSSLLTPKGRLIDTLAVAMPDPETAYLFTSPRHPGASLFQRLDPFIFPMDQVSLKDCSPAVCSFTLVSAKLCDLQAVLDNHILPNLPLADQTEWTLPAHNHCLTIPIGSNAQEPESTLLIVPQTTLPTCAAVGYTFCFLPNDDPSTSSASATTAGMAIWEHLVSERNSKGPVEIGPLELETLRIQAGQPAFGFEMTGAVKDPSETAATPLELHLDATIDFDKGCYLGQEGIASSVKNPRGPPRTLYAVVFEDDFNIYDHQSEGDRSKFENLTRVPKPGDSLYVLGSNEEIAVGTLRSIAEPAGTGEPVTFALALVRRADSIMKRMKDMELQVPTPAITAPDFSGLADDSMSSGIIQPPPLDPLDGLEVIIGGTFTVGRLQMVPSRRMRPGRNMFVDDVPDYVSSMQDDDSDNDGGGGGGFIDVTRIPMTDGGSSLIDASIAAEAAEQAAQENGATMEDDFEDKDDAELEKAMKEVAKAQEEAEVAASEAKRKAEKMELLRKRAEEAIAKRKQKKTGS